MGGHSEVHVQGNENNLREEDSAMPLKIRPIELVKHNTNMFWMFPWQGDSMNAILGGAPTMAISGLGASFGYWYYTRKTAQIADTFYVGMLRKFSRVTLGAAAGLWIGYMRFGDRQRLHNAWIAERLRRRYPESIELHAHDLWKLKGVQAPHAFYKWV